MKNIKYFLQFLIVITLFTLFKFLGLKLSSKLSGYIMYIFGPLFRSNRTADINIKKALPKSTPEEREVLQKYFSQSVRSENDFEQTLKLINKYQIIETCKKRADYFSSVASDSLSVFEKNFVVEKLQELSFYIVNRLN